MILLVLLFNFVVIALVVTGIVFLSRRWGSGDDEAEFDAVRDRVADPEAQVEALAARGDEAAGEAGCGDDR